MDAPRESILSSPIHGLRVGQREQEPNWESCASEKGKKTAALQVEFEDYGDLAALSADSRKLLLYDFKTQKWTDWITEPGAIGFPSWSRDGRHIYYDNTSTTEAAFIRVKVGQTRSELLFDLKDMRRYGGYGRAWSGVAPDDSALLVRDVSSDEIYSLDLELP